MPSRVVDIAGVPVALLASDDERDRALRASLEIFEPTPQPPRATISVDATPATTPARPPHSELLGLEFWAEADGMVVAAPPGLVITVAGDRADAHVPDLAALSSFERCVYLPLTWLLARHDRFILHGAAIVRDGRALLLLGASGAGKSTLAVSALDAGWSALADDVVIVPATMDLAKTARSASTASTGFPRCRPRSAGDSPTPRRDATTRAFAPRSLVPC